MADRPDAKNLEHAINVVCEFVWRRRLPKLPALLAQALLAAAKDDLESQLPTDDEAAAKAEPHCWHCQVALLPEPPPHCENCPSFEFGCDVEGCDAEGCRGEECVRPGCEQCRVVAKAREAVRGG